MVLKVEKSESSAIHVKERDYEDNKNTSAKLLTPVQDDGNVIDLRRLILKQKQRLSTPQKTNVVCSKEENYCIGSCLRKDYASENKGVATIVLTFPPLQ
ncbi:hypothetical protein Y1Q_0004126 [Alligator mississippiensis]|uniref:Uncharacterized protein n=1 Tax=Alligator mississippiensis TaxID=8496 RepID=A0A151PIF6_ALLMI|nr:hypothetical protein Y1Q_0004126 [Alligator mississippiensis]